MSIRESKPLAIIMIDIDNFKLFNDTYGHLEGDKCLKSVAEKIRIKTESLGIENRKAGSVVTVSLGVLATIPSDGMCLDNLINAADRALYQGKEEGRNKVVRLSSLQNNSQID
ncbi:GGDEF domain-containing protein [Asaccharospora irregularis]|uniref:Diguanylate cyclase (GGDEF) domain-containing protein n=1 Tax=Asaccharospora irregularis DSM 2635 TaxID=1121321 RepID=A0A1M5T3F0_9FIRM|nr:GGDEF domain-containing protein [Asaccharospora irregularis]SHH45228.1 diguanylate cyclase (GGDEF) domain-containing protein [Asaccharospora irregularis DSM 2635]